MSLLAIVDTCVIIKALFFRDQYARRVLDSILKQETIIAASDPICEEVILTVMRHAIEAGLTLTQTRTPILKLVKIFLYSKFVNPTISLEVTEHQADNKFFECAYEANIPTIISVNEHISRTKGVKTKAGNLISIYSPWQFINTFKIKG